jgi:predicted RNA-binding Zn ribbon-like protein
MDVSESDIALDRLDLLARFVNTLDYPTGPDALETPDTASQWCRAEGLPPVSNPRELERLRGFREALRGLLFANNGGADPVVGWEALRPYLTGARFGIVVNATDGLSLESAGAGAERAIGMMLAIAYDAAASGAWQRLRACRKSSCRFAYYDHSKNGSRSWCSMAVCGNREKAARRRSRDRH